MKKDKKNIESCIKIRGKIYWLNIVLLYLSKYFRV